MYNGAMHRTQIYLREDQHKKLAALTVKTGAGMSAHIRMAVDEYLKKRKPR
jgi:Ribbon-helix-helix protein, copG family